MLGQTRNNLFAPYCAFFRQTCNTVSRVGTGNQCVDIVI